jgi:hypothetical protein
MISKQLNYKRKAQVMEQIARRLQEIIKKQNISEDETTAVLEFLKNRLRKTNDYTLLNHELITFAAQFPEFKSIVAIYTNQQTEYIQNIGQNSIEELMLEDSEIWEKLSESLDQTNESNLETWIASLPKRTRSNFIQQLVL